MATSALSATHPSTSLLDLHSSQLWNFRTSIFGGPGLNTEHESYALPESTAQDLTHPIPDHVGHNPQDTYAYDLVDSSPAEPDGGRDFGAEFAAELTNWEASSKEGIGTSPASGNDSSQCSTYNNGYDASVEDDMRASPLRTSPESTRSSLEPFDHAFEGKQYDLRPAPRYMLINATTWVDKDNSGNYDPALEGKHSQPKKRKRLPSTKIHLVTSNDSCDTYSKPAKAFQRSLLAARQNGDSLVVTLTLKSEAGKALLDEEKYPSNWPEEAFNILDDRHIYSLVHQQEPGGSLRNSARFKHYRSRSRIDQPTPTNADGHAPILDPLRIEDDLTGHPVARGCVACRELRDPCPLLQDGFTWPCHACIEDGVDCELITPPHKKRTCGECKRRRTSCSYTQDGDPSRSCEQCTDRGSRCIAGPAPGATVERISYDRDYNKFPISQRRAYVRCTACRQAKRTCSLTKKHNDPPCRACKEAGIDCTFEKIAPVRRPIKQLRTAPPIEHPSLNLTNPPVADLVGATELVLTIDHREASSNSHDQSTNKTTTIRTALCHPINFNPGQDGLDCHWCAHNLYGVNGLGWRDVVVFDWDNGLSWYEVSGGHTALGHEQSRMCITCRMERVGICMCAHEIILRTDIGPSTYNPTEASLRLQGVMWMQPMPEDKFCSLCPVAAVYQCGTVQQDNIWGEPLVEAEPRRVGCGLFLCEGCAEKMGNEHECDLQATVKEVLERGEANGFDPRADAEFLLLDGLLMRNMLAGR